jgi:predicted O-linked N-acetylglucosamine transferase (SPINDLY family)
MGLPELVTNSLDEYESLALLLANDRKLLQSYRDRLTRGPAQLHPFNTARTTRQIETAYEAMMARWNKDELPESFSVTE